MSKAINTNTSEEKSHSEFGGSKTEQFINCPASIALSRGIPNKSNMSSNEGTVAHAVLEFFILNRDKLKKMKTRNEVMKAAKKGKTFIEETGETIRWNEEMIEHALDSLTWLEEQIAPNGVMAAETKVESTKFTTNDKKRRQKSTLDVSIINWSARELIIADYKYGRHVVKVKKNWQLIYYALATLLKLKAWGKIDRVRCVIIQPRAPYKGETIREWYVSVDDLIKYGKRIRKSVKLALEFAEQYEKTGKVKNAPLKYGDKWCYFCLAKKKCPVMKEKLAARDFA